MAEKLRLWKGLVWATVVGAFTTSMAYPQDQLSTHKWKAVTPDPRDPHWLLVEGDSDGDFLSDVEEIALGLNPNNPNQNHNRWADGVEFAWKLAGDIETLPVGPLPDRVYRIDYLVYGIEFCEICGHEENMGFVEIFNPMQGRSIQVNFIALHYMTHGSFNYDGTVNDGRVDLVALKEILYGG